MIIILDIVDALTTVRHKILGEELINFILDGIGSKFDPAIVHITYKLDSIYETITFFRKKKNVLQIFEQRLNKSSFYAWEFNGRSVNLATSSKLNIYENWTNKMNDYLGNMQTCLSTLTQHSQSILDSMLNRTIKAC